MKTYQVRALLPQSSFFFSLLLLGLHHPFQCVLPQRYYCWVDGLTIKTCLALIFASSLAACCESPSVAGHWLSNIHFLGDIFPSLLLFSTSHCRIINPFDQYTEITSSAIHKLCRDMRKQMLPALYCLIMITDISVLWRLVFLAVRFPPIHWAELAIGFWVAFPRYLPAENRWHCKLEWSRPDLEEINVWIFAMPKHFPSVILKICMHCVTGKALPTVLHGRSDSAKCVMRMVCLHAVLVVTWTASVGFAYTDSS